MIVIIMQCFIEAIKLWQIGTQNKKKIGALSIYTKGNQGRLKKLADKILVVGIDQVSYGFCKNARSCNN